MRLGERLGEAYQVADDIRDVAADSAELGKPLGRDVALGRPSAVSEHGLEGAVARLERMVAEAIELIPPGAGAAAMRSLITAEAQRLLPKKLARRAA